MTQMLQLNFTEIFFQNIEMYYISGKIIITVFKIFFSSLNRFSFTLSRNKNQKTM